jgi:anti-anti-sigma factor
MSYSFKETPNKIILYLADATLVDESGIQVNDRGLLDLCRRAASSGKKLVVDYRGIQFMTSAMIGTLVLFNKLAKQNNVDIRLANVSPNVMEVFRITRLNKVFRMDDDADDGPDLLGAPVPLPKPPRTDNGRAEPLQD